MLYARVGGKWEAVGTSTTDRWNTAWGVVAIGTFSGNQTVTGTAAQVGSTITFASTVGRRYRATFFVRAVDNSVSTAGWIAAQLQIDSSTYGDMLTYLAPGSGTHYNVVNDQWSFNGNGLASSYRVNCRSSTNCTLYLENTLSAWYVEDVGPVSGAVAIPDPTPAWITATLQGGWTSPNSPVRYRLMGDRVELRGRAVGTTGTIFTLPVGYRPLVDDAIFTVPVINAGAWTNAPLWAQTNGNVGFISGTFSEAALTDVTFSVT